MSRVNTYKKLSKRAKAVLSMEYGVVDNLGISKLNLDDIDRLWRIPNLGDVSRRQIIILYIRMIQR